MSVRHDMLNMDEISLHVEELDREVARMNASPGPPSLREVQQVAHALTQAQLALNDAERRDACERTPSRETADRSVTIRSRIRMLRQELDHAARRDGS